MRWTAIVNPVAGRGRTRRLRAELDAALARRGVPVEVPDDVDGTRQAARAAFRRGDGVVVCGGDGTVAAVAGRGGGVRWDVRGGADRRGERLRPSSGDRGPAAAGRGGAVGGGSGRGVRPGARHVPGRSVGVVHDGGEHGVRFGGEPVGERGAVGDGDAAVPAGGAADVGDVPASGAAGGRGRCGVGRAGVVGRGWEHPVLRRRDDDRPGRRGRRRVARRVRDP